MDLLTRLVKEAAQFPYPTVRSGLIRSLKAAVPIRIQNVADYLYLEADQDKFNFYRDCPNIAPPWPVFFMSYRIPSRLRTRDGWQPAEAPGLELGYLFNGEEEEATGAWTLRCILFQGSLARGVDWRIDKDGRLLPASGIPIKEGAVEYSASPILRWPQCQILDNSPLDLELFAVPFLAISFCHCENVPLLREPVPPKVRAKRERAYGWSPDAWHTLKIEPMRKRLNAAGACEPGGLKRALHIMRGHFKDYRKGRGLFGKNHGMWWWDFRLTDSKHKHQYDISTD